MQIAIVMSQQIAGTATVVMIMMGTAAAATAGGAQMHIVHVSGSAAAVAGLRFDRVR